MVAPNGNQWHDPFSEHHGPPLFIESNRTRAIEDVRTIYIYVAFVTLYTAFLIIFPGIRRDRITTFVSVTTSIIVGAMISDATIGTKWQIGHAFIYSPYRAFSKDRIKADLRVNIGLHSVNITLKATAFITSSHTWSHHHQSSAHHHTTTRSHDDESTVLVALRPIDLFTSDIRSNSNNNKNKNTSVIIRHNSGDRLSARSTVEYIDNEIIFENNKNITDSLIGINDSDDDDDISSGNKDLFTSQHYLDDIHYNERFYWIEPTEMKQEFHKALMRGLPFPILTVAEYLSQDEAGFSWGRRYRYAGYYSHMLLSFSLCIWLLMNVFFCLVPRYSAHLMIALGASLVATNALYALLVPTDPLVIPFEGQNLSFAFGWHYWSLLGSGVLCLCIGSILYVYILLSPDSYTTILDIDYDTHYRYNNLRQYNRASSGINIANTSTISTFPSANELICSTETSVRRTSNNFKTGKLDIATAASEMLATAAARVKEEVETVDTKETTTAPMTTTIATVC